MIIPRRGEQTINQPVEAQYGPIVEQLIMMNIKELGHKIVINED